MKGRERDLIWVDVTVHEKKTTKKQEHENTRYKMHSGWVGPYRHRQLVYVEFFFRCEKAKITRQTAIQFLFSCVH